MRFNTILNELQDIPIKDFKTDNAGNNFGKVYKPEIEADRSPSRFSLNSYNLKKGTITANSEDALYAKVDAFLDKTKNRMATTYNFSSDNKTAYIVYYDRDVSSFDGKYKSALENKIETFVKGHSKTDVKPEFEKQANQSNIQKAIASLSAKSLKDLEKFVSILQARDAHEKSK